MPYPGPEPHPLEKRCIRAEEQQHARELDCTIWPKLPANRPTQCPGDIEHLKCLKNALSECGEDSACREALKRRAEKQWGQCVSYGPRNPVHSPEYQRPCSKQEIDACLKAFVEFMREYESRK